MIIDKKKMFKNTKQNFSAGFTLVELLAAAFIFSVMVIGISGITVRVFELQRRSFTVQKIHENSIFILESMAKEIRVGSLAASTCGGASNCTANNLSIIHPINGPVSYSLSGTNIIRNARGEDNPPGSTFNTTINSISDINVARLDFLIRGLGTDCRQPKVTIVMRVQNKNGNPISIDLQTTIVSRDISAELSDPQVSCP